MSRLVVPRHNGMERKVGLYPLPRGLESNVSSNLFDTSDLLYYIIDVDNKESTKDPLFIKQILK